MRMAEIRRSHREEAEATFMKTAVGVFYSQVAAVWAAEDLRAMGIADACLNLLIPDETDTSL